MPRSTGKHKRLSRNEWLAQALEALSREGGSVLTVDALVQRLNITRGSFYWHFNDRSDFVRQLVDYWSVVFTQGVAKETNELRGNAEERLLALMQAIVRKRLNQYDVPIRAWASYDPVAARQVKKVDEFRTDYVRSLFKEMGFTGDELDMRTRTFVVFYALEPGMFLRVPSKQQLKQLELRHALFVNPLNIRNGSRGNSIRRSRRYVG
jgi:AcrR family transcriptional regulator